MSSVLPLEGNRSPPAAVLSPTSPETMTETEPLLAPAGLPIPPGSGKLRRRSSKELHDEVFEPYYLTNSWQLFCITTYWMYYGFLIGLYVAFTIPSEAMRMAPSWEAGFVTMERCFFGVTHIAAPVAGYYSDISTFDLGKRRPFLVVGMVFQLIGLISVYFLSIHKMVFGYIAMITFTMVGKNIQLAISSSLLADLVPTASTALVSSMSTAAMAFGSICAFTYQFVFPDDPVYNSYLISMCFLAVSFILTMAVVREPPARLVDIAHGTNVDLDEVGADNDASPEQAVSHTKTNLNGASSSGPAGSSSAGGLSRLPTPDSGVIDGASSVDGTPRSTAPPVGYSKRTPKFIQGLVRVFTDSPDYALLTWARVFSCAVSAMMSLFLFFARDVLHIGTHADGIRLMSESALIWQGACLFLALLAGSTVRTIKGKLLMLRIGICMNVVFVCVFIGMSVKVYGLGEEQLQERLEANQNNPKDPLNMIWIMYFGASFYGMMAAAISVGDTSLAMDLVPSTLGHGTAMGMTGPTGTGGFVVGSILLSIVLESGRIPDEKRSPPLPGIDSPESWEVDWRSGFKPNGYIAMYCLALVPALGAVAMVYTMNIQRAWTYTRCGKRGEILGTDRQSGVVTNKDKPNPNEARG